MKAFGVSGGAMYQVREAMDLLAVKLDEEQFPKREKAGSLNQWAGNQPLAPPVN